VANAVAQRRAKPVDISRTFREGNLHDVVEFLCIPGHSGLYLTRTRIRRLAGEMGLRAGVQTRARMLENLFREAGSEGRIEELLGRLDGEAARLLEDAAVWGRACPPGRGAWKDWTVRAKDLRRHLARAKKWARQMQAENLPKE